MTNNHLFRFIVGLDQALNPIIYGGSEDVTLSAQTAYRELVLHKSGRVRKIIDWVFSKLFDHPQHCYHSLYVELEEFPEERELLEKMLADHGVERG